MRFFSKIAVFLAAVFLVSCGTTGGAGRNTDGGSSAVKLVEKQVWLIHEVITLYPDGVISGIVRHNYDDAGNLLMEERFSGSKILAGQKLFTLRKDGVTEITTLDGAGEVLGKALRETADTQVVREKLLNAKMEVQATTEYSYDRSGQKSVWAVNYGTGKSLVSEYVRENGLLARVLVKDAVGTVVKRFELIYGKDKTLSSKTEYDVKDTVIRKILYTYEAGLLVREETRSASDIMLSAIVYTNDGDGNPVKIDYVDREGKLVETRSQTWQAFNRLVRQ